MIRILASDGIDKAAKAKLLALGYEVDEQFYEPEALAQAVAEYDVLVVRSATKVRAPIIDAAAAAGRLKLVIRGGVGVDNIDVAYAEQNGIKVTNTPNASSASVAEMAIAHMFAIARQIPAANLSMRAGKWEKKTLKGIELAGKTLGVIGFGRIGRNTAKIASAIGMEVLYTDVMEVQSDNAAFTRVSFDELIASSDFISLHIPMAEKSVIGKAEITRMKDGVYLVNTARGNLIEETALLEALDSGKVAGAALDVFAEEPTKNEKLYSHPNVSVSPHIAASTKEAQLRIGEEIVSIISEFFH